MNNKQESLASSHANYCRQSDDACQGARIVGTHKKMRPQAAQMQYPRHVTPVLQGAIQSRKNAVDWFFTVTKVWPKGQFAHLDTPFPNDRESRHGIIRSHRIRFALSQKSSDKNLRFCGDWQSQQVASPRDVSFKRLNMGSRRTGDQNASFV